MRRLIALLVTLCALVATMASLQQSAVADVRCKKRDALTGACLIEVTTPAVSNKRQGQRVEVIKSRRSTKPVTCQLDGAPVPCSDGTAKWSNGHGCYLEPMSEQPAKSDPVWQGHSTGRIYNCFLPDDGDPYPVWLANAPGEPPPPDPQVLAQQAVAAMGLRAIRIGIVPEDRAGSVGLVGLPTWLCAEAPGPSSWGPVTRSVSAGGYSVSATGRVDRVVWAMGDGSTVVCRKAGTPYADSFGKRSSPDCGHTYTRQGTYTVRATSYWVVAWAGIGQSGTIPIDFTESTVITVGEAQVLTQ